MRWACLRSHVARGLSAWQPLSLRRTLSGSPIGALPTRHWHARMCTSIPPADDEGKKPFLQSLVEECAHSLGQQSSQAEPIIEVLHRNWFHTASELRTLDSQTAIHLGIPIRLYTVMQRRLADDLEHPPAVPMSEDGSQETEDAEFVALVDAEEAAAELRQRTSPRTEHTAAGEHRSGLTGRDIEWQSGSVEAVTEMQSSMEHSMAQEKNRPKKDPNAPRRPRTAYQFFCRQRREEVKGRRDAGTELGARWASRKNSRNAHTSQAAAPQYSA